MNDDTIVRAPDLDGDDELPTIVRHEEELDVDLAQHQVGRIRAHKYVDAHGVENVVSRDIEEADVERVPVGANDSGQIETLPDGSVSIPLLEEELVISKRTIVRERIIIRKRTLTEHERIEATLRRERVEIAADPGIDLEDDRE